MEQKLRINNTMHLPKWIEYLAHIKDNQPCTKSLVAHRSATTYAHTINVLGEMERQKLISVKKQGREKNVKLTRKGTELFNALKKAGIFAYDEIKQ